MAAVNAAATEFFLDYVGVDRALFHHHSFAKFTKTQPDFKICRSFTIPGDVLWNCAIFCGIFISCLFNDSLPDSRVHVTIKNFRRSREAVLCKSCCCFPEMVKCRNRKHRFNVGSAIFSRLLETGHRLMGACRFQAHHWLSFWSVSDKRHFTVNHWRQRK